VKKEKRDNSDDQPEERFKQLLESLQVDPNAVKQKQNKTKQNNP
jgi:hypothetical protein